MKNLIRISVILPLLVITGCGLYHWRKPNAGPDDFQRDAGFCDGQRAVAADAFNACMQQRGWLLDD